MTYKLYDITLKKESTLDLKNCTIQGNSSLYEVKDGTIKRYNIVDGIVDMTSGVTVPRIELTNYQLALFNMLKGRDGDAGRLDEADLENLTPEILQREMNAIYKKKNVYTAVCADAGECNAELTINKNGTDSEKNISIQFENSGFFGNLLSEANKYKKNLPQTQEAESEDNADGEADVKNESEEANKEPAYTLFDITTKREAEINLKNCTITGNSSVYKVKDGVITKYNIVDGKVDKKSGEEVSRIELTNYQIAFFNLLREKDGNFDRFDEKDLKDLTPEALQEEMNAIYKEKAVYTAVASDAGNYNAEITIKSKDSESEKKIGVEFEKPGFFKRIWNGICGFFKGIGEFFSNLFGGSDDKKAKKKDKEQDKPQMNVDIKPEYKYVAKGGEKPYVLAHDLGVSLYRLKQANPDHNLDWVMEEGQTIVVPETYTVKSGSTKSIEDISKNICVSEDYIRDILFGIEGRHSKPDLTPYYDGVPDETHPKGYLTIGFGHTGRVHGVEMNSKNMDKIQITEAEAYEILAQDILHAKLDAMAYFGEDFEKAPQSIQDAIVDIVFNKGLDGLEKPGSPTCNLKEDLKNRDYVSAAAHVIYKTPVKGLKKRNVYRVALAMKDLKPRQQRKVRERCQKYFNDIHKQYTGMEQDSLTKAWNLEL